MDRHRRRGLGRLPLQALLTKRRAWAALQHPRQRTLRIPPVIRTTRTTRRRRIPEARLRTPRTRPVHGVRGTLPRAATIVSLGVCGS